MRNWLGQDVVPGAVVYRGARDGNTSTYKIGVVEYVKDGHARVEWKYQCGWAWRSGATTRRGDRLTDVPEPLNSKGSPNINSLLVVDQSVLDRCDEVIKLIEQWRDEDMPSPTFRHLLDNLVPV